MIRRLRWQSVPARKGTLSGILNAELSRLDSTYEHFLPNLRGADTLLLGSDYSGEAPSATHVVYSFLLTSLESWASWEPIRLRIRKQFFSDSRRMSFKRLSDGQRRRALPHLLKAANSLEGLSLSIAFNKRSESVFEARPPLDLSNPQFAAFRKWKTEVLEKAFFICHVLGVLLAGLAVPYQNVLWFTDEDSIAANDDRVRELTQLFAWISSLYLRFTLGHCGCGTSRCDNGSRQIEDFLAIPDMIAGALAEQVALRGTDPDDLAEVFWMHRGDFSDKTKTITWWFSDSGSPLRRLAFIVDPAKDGNGLILSTFHFFDQTK
ncbi:MAG: hypothetical protein WBG50_18075 [Desulfomonilaceae bacterium]